MKLQKDFSLFTRNWFVFICNSFVKFWGFYLLIPVIIQLSHVVNSICEISYWSMSVVRCESTWYIGAWSSGTVASRRLDNRHQHHHQLSSSTSTNRLVHCRHNNDCRQPNDALKGGETCHWLYEGCSVGICMCDPMTEKKHPHTGKCIPGKCMP